MQWVYICTAALFACYVFVNKFLRRFNGWYYHLKLRNKEYPLPPGDMGWPLIGNLLSFNKNFSSGQPDSFTTNLILKYLSFSHLFFPCAIYINSILIIQFTQEKTKHVYLLLFGFNFLDMGEMVSTKLTCMEIQVS